MISSNGKRRHKAPEPVQEYYRQSALYLARQLRNQATPGLVFTSATVGEGVTTTAVEITRQFRDALELRPLLIQLDSSGGTKKRRWRAPKESNGTPELLALANGHTLDECIQEGPYGLPLVARSRANGTAMLTGRLQQALKKIMREGGPQYNVIIVDAPPLLTCADALAACEIIPNLVLVVAAGTTRYEMVDRVSRDLAEHRVNIVGTVLNKHKRIIPDWYYKAFLQ